MSFELATDQPLQWELLRLYPITSRAGGARSNVATAYGGTRGLVKLVDTRFEALFGVYALM